MRCITGRSVHKLSLKILMFVSRQIDKHKAAVTGTQKLKFVGKYEELNVNL